MNAIRFSDLCAQGSVAAKRVFIRADLNVPQDALGAITEDTRIRASVPCIRMALDAGAAVMVTSHLGRPTEGEFKPADSLAPVAQRLSETWGQQVVIENKGGAGHGIGAQGPRRHLGRPGPAHGIEPGLPAKPVGTQLRTCIGRTHARLRHQNVARSQGYRARIQRAPGHVLVVQQHRRAGEKRRQVARAKPDFQTRIQGRQQAAQALAL